jgi:caspase-like apoptosis-related cysteine protease
MRGGRENIDVTAFGKLPMELEVEEMVHNPPNHPDFLIVRSTMPDFVSFRNTTHGSWFIQHLCEELNKLGNQLDILTILTFVNQRVSEKESSQGRYKQILCISTMLTKQLIFHKKNHIEQMTK